jgi:hypothetical protein
MAKAKVTRIHSTNKPDKNYIEDPVIVKIAKLALILADQDTDIETKCLCVKAAERFEYVTKEEATQLLLYRTELERFMTHDDEDVRAE